MKKAKRILALASAVLLLAMYGGTFLLAVAGSDSTLGLLKASLVCTVVFPVLLYAYMLVYRVLKGRGYGEPMDSTTADHADAKSSAEAVTGSTEADPSNADGSGI